MNQSSQKTVRPHDIDIVINHDALSFGGDMAPDRAPSKKQIRKRFVPPHEQIAIWKSDYTTMKEEMFLGKPPAFEELIHRDILQTTTSSCKKMGQFRHSPLNQQLLIEQQNL